MQDIYNLESDPLRMNNIAHNKRTSLSLFNLTVRFADEVFVIEEYLCVVTFTYIFCVQRDTPWHPRGRNSLLFL